MAKIAYDVTGVEDFDQAHAPVGIYQAKIEEVEAKESKSGNPMLEVRFGLTKDASGKKADGYTPVWYYVLLEHEHPLMQARLKEFIKAVGMKKAKGNLDTDKLVGTSVQLRLKADQDLEGEYRPAVSEVMALKDADEAEPEEAEEPDVEEEEEDELDLDAMDRKELRALIKEEGLEIEVAKCKSDDDLRDEIAEALEEEPEEEEPEEEEEEEESEDETGDEEEDEDEDEDEDGDEEEDDGYEDMSVSDLKAELKDRELPTNGAKKVLVGRLRADDGGDPSKKGWHGAGAKLPRSPARKEMKAITQQLPVIRTTDLALATYLRAKGVRHLTMDLIEHPDSNRDDQAEWVYQSTPRVAALMEDYENGDALVEPRKSATYLSSVRRELYAFLHLDETEEAAS